MRTGIPEQVSLAIKKQLEPPPADFQSETVQQSSECLTQSSECPTTNNNCATNIETTRTTRDLPDHHLPYMNSDKVVYPVPGDGSCLYRAAAGHLYEE